MSLMPFSLPLAGLRAAVLALAACATAAGAQAAALTVLLADDMPANTEFARELRDGADARSPVQLQRLAGAAPAVALEAAGDEDDGVTAGVRTRGLRASAEAPSFASGGAAAPPTVTIAVGLRAARAAIDRPGRGPLLLAMLSRLDYESLKADPALQRGDCRIGVLLRDPAVADQLALIDAVLRGKRRLGVVVTPESAPLLRELQRAADGWSLQIEQASDPVALAGALRGVLPRSDALLVLPDRVGESQAATLAVLRAGAAAGLPVFGGSDGLVRSGALAGAIATPAQLARQALALSEKLAACGPGRGPLVEDAAPAAVRVNTTVARGLGLRVPDERVLIERVTAVR